MGTPVLLLHIRMQHVNSAKQMFLPNISETWMLHKEKLSDLPISMQNTNAYFMFVHQKIRVYKNQKYKQKEPIFLNEILISTFTKNYYLCTMSAILG